MTPDRPRGGAPEGGEPAPEADAVILEGGVEGAPDPVEGGLVAPGSGGHHVAQLPVAPELDDDQGHRAVVDLPAALAGGLGTVDDGELLDRLDAARAKRKARLAAEELAHAANGGPCADCGRTWSTALERGKPVGRWYADPVGLRCHRCHLDSREHGQEQLANRDDADYRDLACRRLLAPLDPVEVAQHSGHPDYGLAARSGFRWFREVPGAKPGGRERFAYLDLPAMLARLRPPKVTEELVRGAPCGKCGAMDHWHPRKTHHPGVPGMVSMPPWTEEATDCRHPRHLQLPDDLDEAAAKLTGLAPAYGLGAALGISWWAEHVEALPRRQRLRARVRGPQGGPLSWWPPTEALRAKAWELFRPQPDQWMREAENRWQSLQAMRDAQAAHDALERTAAGARGE